MSIGPHLLLPTLLLSLLACFNKDTSDDDDDDDGGGGGGWDLGTGDDTGVHGDGGGGDGGGDGGGGDGGGDGGSDGGGDGGGGEPGDEDGDGFTVAEGDCDDDDRDVYPDAYDRPDDGVDQDCVDGDRHFDGVVLDPGERSTVSFSVDLVGGAVDLALIVDTTGSMEDELSALDADRIVTLLEDLDLDMQTSLATFADYNFSGYGEGSDLPFVYQVGSTTDVSEVQGLVEDLAASGGADGPESGMEALYQALSGAGYDQDCDGRFDPADDVPPFLASASDPFGGVAAESYDARTPGIGELGGLGFRDGAVPVLVYITDNYLRDDDSASYGTPGGCPGDAGKSDVVDAAGALGAILVGVATQASTPLSQMQDLATETGSLVDDDGDGRVDDEAVFMWSGSSDLAVDIVDMINLIDETGAFGARYDLVRAETTLDAFGLVTGIAPGTYTGVDGRDTPTLDFTITLVAPSASSSKRQTAIEVEVRGDGDLLYTYELQVELAPG